MISKKTCRWVLMLATSAILCACHFEKTSNAPSLQSHVYPTRPSMNQKDFENIEKGLAKESEDKRFLQRGDGAFASE